MRLPSLLRRAARVLLALPLAVGAQESKPTQFRFQLIDADGCVIAGAPTRLVLASGANWQLPSAGFRAVTSDAGDVSWSVDVAPERRRLKLPTNFFTQALSPLEDTNHVAIGAELTYLGQAWLVVASGDRFENGATVQTDGIKIYGRDPTGRFSVPVTQKAGAWYFPGVAGALTTQGFSVQSLTIAPAMQGWTVDLVLKKANEPVIR